jgi:molybdopterin synthase catalytic subunit
VAELELEHYPGMTERALEDIVEQARARWPLYGALVIHRVGPMRRWSRSCWWPAARRTAAKPSPPANSSSIT